MKGYRKLTLITAILGLVILVPFVVGYAYVNSLIGLPILGLFLGWLLLYVFLLLIVNIASLYITFRIKNFRLSQNRWTKNAQTKSAVTENRKRIIFRYSIIHILGVSH